MLKLHGCCCCNSTAAWYSVCRSSLVLSGAISTSLFQEPFALWSLKKLGFITAERSMDVPVWKGGLKFLQIWKQNIPAAVHFIVVETPSGMVWTHRFATETVDLPAQEGERVTIALAAPTIVYREIGPLKLSPKIPNLYPGEPMCLTNHSDGRESPLLRAPQKIMAHP